MPNATSREMAPVGITPTGARPSAPSRMTAPLPNWCSIRASASSNAFSRSWSVMNDIRVTAACSRCQPLDLVGGVRVGPERGAEIHLDRPGGATNVEPVHLPDRAPGAHRVARLQPGAVVDRGAGVEIRLALAAESLSTFPAQCGVHRVAFRLADVVISGRTGRPHWWPGRSSARRAVPPPLPK